jgi:hypothetical protein
MENPEQTSNSGEENGDGKTLPENADASNATEFDASKSSGDGEASKSEDAVDNTNTVETTDPTGATEQNTDDPGTTDLKSEGTVEAQGNSPVKKDGADSSEELPAAESETQNEHAATAHDPGTKSEPTSPKDDGIVVDKTTKPAASPTVSENQKSEPVVKEEDSVSMDVDSSETNEPDTPAEESVKAPAETSNTNSNTTTTYSTRGRSTEAAAVEEKPERIHVRDAFEESPRPKDPPLGVSFLVEAMTEEERRTRTRFLPDVDGMQMLRKNEIKEDLALASSLPSTISPSGVLQTRTGRIGSASGRSNDSMDVDGDELNLTINDEGTKIIDLPSRTLTIPSDAFVAPKGVVVGDTDNSIEVKDFEATAQSPSKVDSVMSFNPPRPPESVGGKKKHRMIRWERRPEDIEVDMKNYRRTVQRTRQELKKSEFQYDRLEMIDAHLRHHFLNHSDLLDKEYENLQNQLEVELEKLMKESDLVGSRTRSRNLTKVDVVMRDVLTMLTRNEQKDISMDGAYNEEPVSNSLLPGIGGLNSQAFSDWERSTELEPMSPCVSWIEPGQRVTTPNGEGTVISIIPPETPTTGDGFRNLTTNDGKKSDPKKASRNEMVEETLNDIHEKKKYDSLMPLRIKVRLDYGIGVFGASSISKMENPAHFTDAKLAKRWKGMIDSALEVGPCIDLQGMIPNVDKNEDEKAIASTEISGNLERPNYNFLRVGASLIPTKFGRGNFLHDMKIEDIEDSLQNVLYGGHGVLGRVSCEKLI